MPGKSVSWLLCSSFLLLSACMTTERVVLLPQPDGGDSAVVVRAKGQELVLGKAYATADIALLGMASGTTDEADVARRYGALADALPQRPRSFLLYFESGGDRLTAESETTLSGIFEQLKQMQAPEIMVIGHTDSVGGDAMNDELSGARAGKVRQLLLDKGLDPLKIEAIGRGKRDLLVPTPDGTAEPRNRRVEVRLR